MAELLVKAADHSLPDPDQDKWAWKRGDVVDIREDGHPWGAKEGPPMFALIKVPGVAVEALERLRDQPMVIGAADLEPTGRRKNKIHLDEFTGSVRAAIPAGRATVTLSQLRARARSKDKGETIL